MTTVKTESDFNGGEKIAVFEHNLWHHYLHYVVYLFSISERTSRSSPKFVKDLNDRTFAFFLGFAFDRIYESRIHLPVSVRHSHDHDDTGLNRERFHQLLSLRKKKS